MSDIPVPEVPDFDPTRTDQPRHLTRSELRQRARDMEFFMFGGVIASRGAGCPPPPGYGESHDASDDAPQPGDYVMTLDRSGNYPSVSYGVIEGPVLPTVDQA